jgi:hypothetical protein
MIEITLKPTLSQCIHSIAKTEYEHVLHTLLKKEEKSNHLEKKLELLRLFLESTDFGELRSQHENALCNGKKVIFKLRLINGCVEYEQV